MFELLKTPLLMTCSLLTAHDVIISLSHYHDEIKSLQTNRYHTIQSGSGIRHRSESTDSNQSTKQRYSQGVSGFCIFHEIVRKTRYLLILGTFQVHPLRFSLMTVLNVYQMETQTFIAINSRSVSVLSSSSFPSKIIYKAGKYLWYSSCLTYVVTFQRAFQSVLGPSTFLSVRAFSSCLRKCLS